MALKIIALVLPLGLDTFAVSAALGLIGERAREGAERLAATALALLAIGLLIANLTR